MLPTVDTRRARRAERIAGGRVRPTASDEAEAACEGRVPATGMRERRPAPNPVA